MIFVTNIIYNTIQYCQTIRTLNNKILSLENENKKLKNELLKCKCHVPLYQKLLTNRTKTRFYTGIESYELFCKLHDFIAPFVRKRYYCFKESVKSASKLKRNFQNSPKKMGPTRKLESKDEFLLMLMKLKLDVLLEDLGDRFRISAAHCGRVYSSWPRASAALLQNIIYAPDKGHFISHNTYKI